MKIEFTGRQMDVPAEVRTLAERKLAKLARVLTGITRAHVIVTADKHRQIAEVTVHSRKVELTAQSRSNDLGLSVSDVMDKLLRQAQRYVGKRRERKRGPSPRTLAPRVEGRPGEDGAPRVVRSRRFPVKPMTLDEAALEVGSREEGFLVFRDAATERVTVLFKRKDGNLGLIEPEA
ncbi:MAG TPA: ribosome-associated translation inhibitor RaiA [Vicinamibacteria bacterium]|nr:ribosome-associated translation inhibitor RaiA [Vicinamibacteria bacterium]